MITTTDNGSGTEVQTLPAELRRLLDANRRYAERRGRRDLPAQPSLAVALVTCMDARFHPAGVLGLEDGEAHVIRNAGGRVTDDALRSLIVSTHVMHTRTVLVLHHTDCGMSKTDQAGLTQVVTDAVGRSPVGIDFCTIADPLEALIEDVARVRDCDLLPADLEIFGGIIDVETALIDVHVVASRSSS